MQQQTPLTLPGIRENLYAGFWLRLGSLFMDFVIFLPLLLLVLYINHLGKNWYFITVVPNMLIGLWYHIYLPKKHGGTPGKLICGMKIIRLDGSDIGYKEAVMRYVVMFFITLLSIILMSSCVIQADDEVYKSMSWLQQSGYLMSLSPGFFTLYSWASNIWIYSEFITLLTNKRKRAIHDFMAGTVIVRAKYLPAIRAYMAAQSVNS